MEFECGIEVGARNIPEFDGKRQNLDGHKTLDASSAEHTRAIVLQQIVIIQMLQIRSLKPQLYISNSSFIDDDAKHSRSKSSRIQPPTPVTQPPTPEYATANTGYTTANTGYTTANTKLEKVHAGFKPQP